MMRKTRINHILLNKNQIFIKNFHPSIKAPISYSSITKIVKKVMIGEDCHNYILYINLLGNGEIRRINRKFLNHDFFTDIITFPYSNGKSEKEGELFISLDEVKSNSVIYNDSFKNELARVVIHGCLHLNDYNDKTKIQKELIRNKENYYLSKLKKRIA